MFGSHLKVTSRDDLDALVKKDPRYMAAVMAHHFVIKDNGRQNALMGNVYYGPRYEASIKCPWSFGSWVRDSGLFTEEEVNNLVYWITKDNL